MTEKSKKLLGTLACTVTGIGAAHICSSLTLDRVVEYKNITVTSSKITEEMDGYKAVFITDVHYMLPGRLAEVVDEIAKLSPDVVLLGGDFAEERAMARSQLEIIASLAPADGIYGVAGNHDTGNRLQKAMAENNMGLLSNRGVHIGKGFYLCGVEDIRRGIPDIKLASMGADANDFVLMLSHNPDIAELQNISGIDLVLSGHTHGGQMTVFGKFAPALYIVSNYGHKYKDGIVRTGGSTVYISKGLGSHRYMFRMFARPELTVITFKHKR